MNTNRTTTAIAIAALALCVLQWIWGSWRSGTELSALRQEVESLRGDLALIRRNSGSGSESIGSLSDERLQRCLEDLGTSSIIVRYEAGMVVREYGEKAVPGLLALVQEGNSRAKQAALLLLGDLRSPVSASPLRELARNEVRKSAPGEAKGDVTLDATTLAGLLGVLARLGDTESVPLFREALRDPREAVCAAAVVGLRDTDAVAAVPDLAGLLDHESVIVRKEAERAIRKFCEQSPESLVTSLSAGSAPRRFRTLRFLKDEKSDASREALRGLLQDTDPRIALGAARVLAGTRDEAVRQTVKKVASTCPSGEVRRLAREVLKEIDGSELSELASDIVEGTAAAELGLLGKSPPASEADAKRVAAQKSRSVNRD